MEDLSLRYELFNDLIKDFALNQVKPLAKEVDERYEGEEISTIYFGGGTPSSLSIDELQKLCPIKVDPQEKFR